MLEVVRKILNASARSYRDDQAQIWLETAPLLTMPVLTPRKPYAVMDERLRFVAKLLDGESMTDACRQFGISRKTDYKVFQRYKDSGVEALCDRSRRPVRYARCLLDDAAQCRTESRKSHARDDVHSRIVRSHGSAAR